MTIIISTYTYWGFKLFQFFCRGDFQNIIQILDLTDIIESNLWLIHASIYLFQTKSDICTAVKGLSM